MLDYTLLIPTFTPTTITTAFSNTYPQDDLPTAQYYVGAHSNDSYHDDDDDDLSYYESTPAPAFYAALYYHELKPFAPTSTSDPFASMLPPQVTLYLPTLTHIYPYPVTPDTYPIITLLCYFAAELPWVRFLMAAYKLIVPNNSLATFGSKATDKPLRPPKPRL
jgi:hypothetical protein